MECWSPKHVLDSDLHFCHVQSKFTYNTRVIMPKITLIFFYFIMLTPIVSVALPDFTEMVKNNGGSVVNIKSQSQSLPTRPSFIGSGFIISKQGYILTNYHVIKNANIIIVKLKDKQEFIAQLIGFDESMDTALLKIVGNQFSFAKIGNPEKLKVGEWVIAIGSPYGFEQSVTAGIVSGKNRRLPTEKNITFIQSDVVINPGNSGGPLFNLEGEVIGINSQIYSDSGAYQGLSFAMPIDAVMHVVTQIKNKGHVSYGWIGIQTQDLSENLADAFSMKKPYGALISKIVVSSPADEAGLKVGDIIVIFDNEAIKEASQLPPKIRMITVGKKVFATIIRQGKIREISLKVGLLPSKEFVIEKEFKKKVQFLGVTVSSLTLNDREVFGIDKYGVLVSSVINHSPAFQFGLQQGDIILGVQGNHVWNVDSFESLINQLPIGIKIAFLIQRQGIRMFIPLEITK